MCTKYNNTDPFSNSMNIFQFLILINFQQLSNLSFESEFVELSPTICIISQKANSSPFPESCLWTMWYLITICIVQFSRPSFIIILVAAWFFMFIVMGSDIQRPTIIFSPDSFFYKKNNALLWFLKLTEIFSTMSWVLQLIFQLIWSTWSRVMSVWGSSSVHMWKTYVHAS